MRLLHATDFSACADHALDFALRLARSAGGELVLLHVHTDSPTWIEDLRGTEKVEQLHDKILADNRRRLDERVERCRAAGVAAEAEFRGGVPVEEIVAAARERGADLIVIGTHGRSGLARALLGSVTDRLIRTSPVPVLSVREGEPAGA